ncbi:Ig-like domain-containing protein [uncultured Roseivirga sp.]|uniref:Ig-like domain-containing protein n=1 Tax=uncultured Roseivirga sp. TaxID=543088 RepID=UPI0030D90A0F
MKRLLIFTLMLFSVVHISAQECDVLSSEWLNPSPQTTVFNYSSGRLTGIPDPANSNNPTDSKTIFEGFTSPTPGTTPVGAVTLGLGFLSDANDNLRIDVIVYNDNAGKPGTAVGGVTGLSPTALGVTHAFKEIWVELPSLPVPTTSRFYVGVVMHPGDASDQLVVQSNAKGQGNGDGSNSITTTKFGNEKLLNTYSSDVDLKVLPKLGIIEDASFSYSSSSYCSNGADPSATITGDTGGTFTSSPAGLSINSSTGRIDLSASTLGTYTVRYTTNGSCPVSETRTVAVAYDAPVISCPTNKTININAATTTTVPDYRAMATVNDGCDPNPTVTQSPLPGTVVGLGNHTITLRAQDAASNVATCTFNLLVRDVTAPAVTIASTAADPINGAFTTTFTFSEGVAGFAIGDITIANGTASNFTATSATIYTALVTPTTDGAVTVDVAANAAQDAASNGNTAATQFSLTADLTNPTVNITSTAADPINGAFTTTFTFSEGVTGFVIGDITLNNASASNFTAISATVYTALITATTDGAVTVDVAANVAQDAATNGNTAATQFSITADLTSPTVAITSTVANPINGAFTTTFTFSEAMTGFAVGDITLNNASASNFTAVSTSVYTALITPTTDGAVTVDVAANVAQDAATNENTAATQFSITADLTNPTVLISSTAADPIDGAFLTTFTFSEGVTGFAIGDIILNNASASNFTAISATVYTALITPTTDGAVTVDVAANVVQDAAINGNTAATQFSITADLTNPTVLISSTTADPINGVFTATFTFSEVVTGFAIGDITVANGTTTNFTSTSASVYTVLITPTTDGVVTVDVAANSAQDAATNGNTVATQFSITADLTKPTVNITSTAADPINGAFTTTFTFSEAVTGFAVGDITVGNGTASNFTSTSATVYTALITPTADGAVTVNVAANVVQDAATNGNTAATQFSITADLTSPTVTITSTAADPINGAFLTTVTFNEAVTGFTLGDITVGNGVASNFASTSATVYTALITPTIDGAVTVDVAANVAQDAATNGNTAATQFSITADLTNPTVNITSTTADPINGAFTTTFTFSEAVTSFVVEDITLSNASASNFTAISATVYTALITPTTDGAITVDVAANVAQDAATNGNTIATQFDITADLTDPTVLISSTAADPINGAFTATFTFSEAVTGFAIGDIALNNASASNFTAITTTVYTALITPTTDGAITVDVAANVAQDAATNGNTIATQFSINADMTNPMVLITSTAANPINGAFTTTFTFNEAVTGFVVGDITLNNASASNFTAISATVYTALITPTTDGAVTVDVAANSAQDAATNGNTAATQFSIRADFTAPTVIVQGVPTELNTFDPFTVTFSFSEPVAGFASNDFVLDNLSVISFSVVDASNYEVSLKAITNEDVSLKLPVNSLQDLAGNTNTLETTMNISFNSLPMDISLSEINIDENNALAAEIGLLATTDADLGDIHSYNLVAGTGSEDNDQFSITFDKLRAATTFNYETKSSYKIRVKTDDGKGGLLEKTFAISINDVNEQPTDIALSNTLIDETDESSVLVGVFATTDQDNGDTFAYELITGNGSANNNFFAISNGQLHTNQAINFEEHELLSIRVKVTDSGGLSFEKAFEIGVKNVVNEDLRDFTKDAPDARVKNFFTPNNDGMNDFWVIEDIKDNPVNEVKVFTQSGKMVFSAKDYQNDWAGKFEDSVLPSGTYYYEINISNGQAIVRGTLLILTK